MEMTTTNPAILYFGTPVVLISTLGEDSRPNLAPMSSAWWLGHRCMLGLAASSKTTENLLRSGECVLNLPSVEQVDHVDRLALTTGSDPVPGGKRRRGYRHVADKFGLAGLDPIPSDLVAAPRAAQCPVQMEARLVDCQSWPAKATYRP
ncbi:MAG TPA: flavin reductase family protein [Thermoleophilaceae bacterium]|nr:flavin reductase family protein [Thermoleophilaceae bacterium]